MRYSELFLPTGREAPSDAEVISHKLMIRAGMIRKLASGIYSWLPLGYRVIRKIEEIIRQEMNRAGAQEVHLPMVQPAELWQESQRWVQYGKELLRFRDRHERDYCLGPTHEEVITDLVRNEIKTYRQLPKNLYQIQTKFRDEIRPRFGVMRAREFVMKDAYSFDADEAGAELSYRKMFVAYQEIFQKCGLNFRAVEADSGSIGGSFSHEFMVLAESGEDAIVYCHSCNYAANIERSEAPLLSQPAEEPPELLPRAEVLTPGVTTIAEVSSFLGVDPSSIVKTLIYDADGVAVAVLIRGDQDLNEIKLKNYLGSVNLELASEAMIMKATGAPRGFAGAVGIKTRIIADNSLQGMTNFVLGANKENYHLVNVNIARDFTVSAYADLRLIKEQDRCARCGGEISIARGIEVGHVFKLGTKYSKAMRCAFLDNTGTERIMIMGCYGIGVGRTMAAAIEQNYDANGIIWPLSLAPFQVIVLPVNVNDPSQREEAEKIYHKLLEQGIEALLDDRDERAGVKFKDADLIGIPLRVTVGPKGLQEGRVELRVRKTGDVSLVEVNSIAVRVVDYVRENLGVVFNQC